MVLALAQQAAHARELRRALDQLLDLAEEAGEKVCVVEDAHGLEYPASEGELPAAAEQAKARAGLGAALGELARIEDRLGKQLAAMAKARWALARARRSEQ
jgi:hypothetical protein